MAYTFKENKMLKLQTLAKQQPKLFTALLVITCILVLYSTSLFNFSNEFNKDLISSVIKNGISLTLLWLLIKNNWLNGSLLTTPYKEWHAKWLLASIPMALVALLNVVTIDWSILEFTSVKVVGWLYTNISTGIFEELMLRGVCFYVLYLAWKDNKNGLMQAALWQAIIFGLAHYVNLTKAPFLEVSVQVTYATLIGIGFAGLVAYTRSLWPAIVIHSLINSFGSINNFFQPNFVPTEMSMANYAVVVTIIALICALPGYLLLKKTNTHLATQQLTTS